MNIFRDEKRIRGDLVLIEVSKHKHAPAYSQPLPK